MMRKEELEKQKNEIGKYLVTELNPEGYWDGRLSSSALAVAVAVTALTFDGYQKHHNEINRGYSWLKNNINDDGSFGDTPESPGNVSTSLLVYAAVHLPEASDTEMEKLRERIAAYLFSQNIDVRSPQVSDAILKHYQRDYTFSVPILAMSALCGVPGKDAFRYIPQLPFELSLLPRRFYRLLNLSVVSYAIPALVAVGIVIFKRKKSSLFWRLVRRFSIKKGLSILHQMLPQSGGYLEAIPLTAFVSLSLIKAGYSGTAVVEKGIRFLKNTQREDGSWPIDVDLSTWVTSLSVKAFRSGINGFLTTDQQDKIADHFRLIQNIKVHPFNGTGPGGWGWTQFSGSVPDGDDTPGVILALLRLQPRALVKKEVLAGCQWLTRLQNNDGGFPTFSSGWGKLPFDQSCSDLTGHNLLALSTVLETYENELTSRQKRGLKKAFEKALLFLEKHQCNNGSWLPLWFGNQFTRDHTNPVYGTARVLTYLKDAATQTWMTAEVKRRLGIVIKKGVRFLISVRNPDGSWGGAKNTPGTIEETALAIAALASVENRELCHAGLKWLGGFYKTSGLKPAPVGLYFASLWYHEKLYPSTAWLEAVTRVLETEG